MMSVRLPTLLNYIFKMRTMKFFKYYNGTDGLNSIQNNIFDLAILDIMLPDINGFQLCQKIRENYCYPVIMLYSKK